MFMTTRDQGPRRRSRVYGVNKPARSSKLSLLSAFTEASNGSNGSTSTVTQNSYSHSRTKHTSDRRKSSSSRRKKPREERTSRSKQKHDSEDADKTSGEVDVFAFLVKEDVEGEKTEPTISPIVHQAPTTVYDSDPECYYRSHHSDSGVSMGSGSVDLSSSEQFSRRSLPPLIEEIPDIDSRSRSIDATTTHMLSNPPWSPHCDYQYCITEEPYNADDTRSFHSNPVRRTARRSIDVPIDTTSIASSQSFRPTTSIALDQDGAENGGLRCFRTFEKINLRLILQMQDDIAELEDELAQLDMQYRLSTATPEHSSEEDEHEDELDAPEPQSTQEEGPESTNTEETSEISHRRVEIYQELHFRLQQYHKSIFSAQKLLSISRPARSQDEISNYQTWLTAHVAPASRLTHLLGSGADLAFLQPSSTSTPSPPTTTIETLTPRVLALLTCTNAVLPLLFFGLVRSVLNRMVAVAAGIVVGALALERVQGRPAVQRGTLSFIAVLGCVVAVAAVVL